MNPEELRALRELLGEGFTLKEAEDLAREDPSLLASAASLRRNFQEGLSEAPPLSPYFTERLLQALPPPSPWKQYWQALATWRVFAMAATAFFCGVAYLGYQHFLASPQPVARFQADGEVKRRVRFQARELQAQSVAVAGDFNQWIPWPLQRQADGSFAGEWELPEGSYAYSFLVDGKKWVLDAGADAKVEDGFGNKNSLLSL